MSKSSPKIFISYSHQDKEWKDLIKKHLTVSRKFDIWYDGDIELDGYIHDEIVEAIESTDIALLLISSDFLNSKYIMEEEVPRFLKASQKGELQIIRVLLSPCEWETQAWLTKQLGFPYDYHPLLSFFRLNEECHAKSYHINNEIVKLVKYLTNKYCIESNEIPQKYIEELTSPYQFIINYLNEKNITPERLLMSVKKYVNQRLYNILSSYTDIEKVVTHLSDEKAFACVVHDVFSHDNDLIKEWLQENYKPCQELEKKGEPRVVMVFTSKHDGEKYDVTFSSVNVPNMSNSNASYDLTDEMSKNELIKEMMRYVQLGNPKVDLVLPVELMCQNMNLWEVEFCESLSRFSQLNIRDITRYKGAENNSVKELLVSQWGEVLEKVEKNKGLCCISSTDDIRAIGNDMNVCGVASKMLLESSHLNFLLKTNMSYIMLWVTEDIDEDLQPYYKEANQLQRNYHALQDKPINLMWDDPTNYYHPKGD